MTEHGRRRRCRGWTAPLTIVPFGGIRDFCILHLAILLPSHAYATEGTRSAYAPPPPAVSSGSIMQIILSLLLVLAAIVLVAWLLKRMNTAQQGSGHLLKMLGSISIGQRERIVLVEIDRTWLVIGVGPGQIRTLHTLPKTDSAVSDLPSRETPLPDNKFASLLSSVLSRPKGGAGSK